MPNAQEIDYYQLFDIINESSLISTKIDGTFRTKRITRTFFE